MSLARRTYRVVLVEDDADFRETVAAWLAFQGHAVRVAPDGRAALALLAEAAADVVVTDMRMPDIDGLALLDAIHLAHPGTPVIFLSGQATRTEVIAALREGRSFDFIEKPVHDLEVVGRAIGRAIGVRRLEPAAPSPSRAPYSAPTQAALAAIAARFREPLGMASLARDTCYSAAYLSDVVSRETGKTVTQWILKHRLEEARRLLAATDEPIAQLARSVGFQDAGYFARAFRRAYGVTPHDFRREAQEATTGDPNTV